MICRIAVTFVFLLLVGCPPAPGQCEADKNGLTICRAVRGESAIMRDENTGVTCFSAAEMRCFGPDGVEIIAEK